MPPPDTCGDATDAFAPARAWLTHQGFAPFAFQQEVWAGMGGQMALSTQLAAATRQLIAAARNGEFTSPELKLVRPLLELQARWAARPAETKGWSRSSATR